MRNRLRRQLRAVMADAGRANAVSPGWYLVGADAPALAMTFGQLNQAFPALAATAAKRNSARQANSGHQANEAKQ